MVPDVRIQCPWPVRRMWIPQIMRCDGSVAHSVWCHERKWKSQSRVLPFVTPRTVTTRLFCPWDFPGKNTGVGYYFLIQGIFPTQGSNSGLLHCRQILYQLSHYARVLCPPLTPRVYSDSFPLSRLSNHLLFRRIFNQGSVKSTLTAPWEMESYAASNIVSLDLIYSYIILHWFSLYC